VRRKSFRLDVLNAVKAAARLQEEKILTSRSDKRVGHVVASPVADALCSTAVHASLAMKSMAFVVPTETGFHADGCWRNFVKPCQCWLYRPILMSYDNFVWRGE